jgi:hypothetical protein
MDGLDNAGFMFIGGETPKHPQHNILKGHIERAVQDLFLEALRNQPIELFYVFETVEQIDSFVNRILSYWEKLEKYEICQEVVKLSKEFKLKWDDRDKMDPSEAVIRIKDIFGSTFK